MENWKAIDNYDNYEVSTYGNVRNVKSGKILKFGVGTRGYFYVNLSKNGKKKNTTIHKLVATAFLDNPDAKECVDHIDGIKTNNNISNLRYATKKENGQNSKMSKNNTSGVKGVYWNKQKQKWEAQIMVDRIKIHLGLFNDIEDAKKARIKKANEVFGVYINACEKL